MRPWPLRLLLQQSQRQQPRLIPQQQSPLPLPNQQLWLRQMRLQPQLLQLQSRPPTSVPLRRVLACNQVCGAQSMQAAKTSVLLTAGLRA